MQLKSIIVYYGEPIEAFENLMTFCNKKKLKYNTYKQKKLPFVYDGFSVEKEKPGERNEYITRMGELIKIQ